MNGIRSTALKPAVRKAAIFRSLFENNRSNPSSAAAAKRFSLRRHRS